MIGQVRTRSQKKVWGLAAAFVVTLALTGLTVTSAQDPYYPQQQLPRGQNIAPAFEGWEENPDVSFNMVFGYSNRNWEEQPLAPIGPNNNVEPCGPDRGNRTLFIPRRNTFVVHAAVPHEFSNNEIVWTSM